MLANTLILFSLASAATAPSTLSGTVTDELGKPIPGATVSIYTAKPREGIGTLCPSCYRDCNKSTTTGGNGDYAFTQLDGALLFRVLVTAPGLRSVVTKHVDPRDQESETTLLKLPTDLPDNRQLSGRIVDSQGKPVVGAIVMPFGAKTTGRRWWGRMPGVDSAAVSDVDGRFVVTSKDRKLGMDFKVYARGYATKITPLFDLDGETKTIQLNVGAHVSGQLVHKGKPVAGRAIGIVQVNRSSGTFVGETTLATDENGMFTFFNLQTDDKYVVYTLCDVAAKTGAAELLTMKAKRLTTGQDGQTLDVDKLELGEGVSFSGRVILPNNEPIPDNSTLRLSRTLAWDWANVTISQNGSFRVDGLPPEVFKVYVNVEGFDIDSDKTSFQMVGNNAFGVSMKKNRSNILITLREAHAAR
ncbi:carboxypeptidase regulatory-like domain-containing protein [Planctomycetota bacterium]